MQNIEKINLAKKKISRIKNKIHSICTSRNTAMQFIKDIEYTIKDIIDSIPQNSK